MRLGVVVLAYRNPEQVALLVSALRHPDVRVYLHVDARSPWPPFRQALERSGDGRVHTLARRATPWGGPAIVDASVDGLAAAVADDCDYVLQISGQDLPLWYTDRLVAFFRDNLHKSFMQHVPLPTDRWRLGGRLRTECYSYQVRGRRETHVPRSMEVPMSWKGRILNAFLGLRSLLRPPRTFPDCAAPHGGSSGWNLSRPAVEHVLAFLEAHPEYRRYHEDSLLPDEIFFQSIVAGTWFARDHEIVDDALRFQIWRADASHGGTRTLSGLPAAGEARGAHPRTLTLDDLPALGEAQEPFARKFDMEADPQVVRAVLEARR